MWHRLTERLFLTHAAVLAGVLLLGGMALAQWGGGYDLSWSTADGGGASFSAGETYSLGGTAGQPDAGLLTGGSYALRGGFWGGAAAMAATYEVYLPLMMRDTP